jgi:hypothetical protein
VSAVTAWGVGRPSRLAVGVPKFAYPFKGTTEIKVFVANVRKHIAIRGARSLLGLALGQIHDSN